MTWTGTRTTALTSRNLSPWSAASLRCATSTSSARSRMPSAILGPAEKAAFLWSGRTPWPLLWRNIYYCLKALLQNMTHNVTKIIWWCKIKVFFFETREVCIVSYCMNGGRWVWTIAQTSSWCFWCFPKTLQWFMLTLDILPWTLKLSSEKKQHRCCHNSEDVHHFCEMWVIFYFCFLTVSVYKLSFLRMPIKFILRFLQGR